MACPSLESGDRFLATALVHIDCQAQTLGSFGFAGLADPSSPASLALTSLLAVFVALFGVRLLLGYAVAGRDLVGDVLKIGIVLTLATSWAAWRVIGYGLVIDGPGEVARAVGLAAQLPGLSGDLADRLQRVDDALAALNLYGSGRLGVAQGDWLQLGFARVVFLAVTLGAQALVRLSAGILLAIAPLMAGLLLFSVSRAVFVGWARGLSAAFLASVALTLAQGAQLAVLEPWLQDVLDKRAANQPVLDAPIEILAATLAFAVIDLGVLAVMARIAFHPSAAMSVSSPSRHEMREVRHGAPEQVMLSTADGVASPTRAMSVAASVSESIHREERLIESRRLPGSDGPAASARAADGRPADPSPNLGSSYRRTGRRVSAASTRRDRTP